MLIKRLLFACGILVIYCVVSYNVASRKFTPTGDEPHYLVITHSLAIDGDISLLNNYKEQHYRIFYPSILAKRTTASADKSREIPTFGLGMPLFLTPWYRWFYEYAPEKLVAYLRMVICLVAAFGIFQLLSFGFELTGRFWIAAWITAGAALASPIITYSSQFYPEIFGFVLLITALRSLYKKHILSTLLLSLIPGMLMWLHPKYLALAVVLTAITAVQIRKEAKPIRALHLLIAVLGIFSFFYFLHDKYGSWSPNRIYGGWQKQSSLLDLLQQEGPERIGVMIKMFFGFWFDDRFGLLPYAPFYVAFFAAVVWCVRWKKSVVYPALILFGLHLLPLCWGAPLGGYAPPARHFVVMIPLILAPIFLFAPNWISEQKALFVTMQGVALFVAIEMMMNYRSIFANLTWRNPDGQSDFWPILHLQNWIPNCISNHPQVLLISCWLIASIFFAFCLYPRRSIIFTKEHE
jgi:hypothetical protein